MQNSFSNLQFSQDPEGWTGSKIHQQFEEIWVIGRPSKLLSILALLHRMKQLEFTHSSIHDGPYFSDKDTMSHQRASFPSLIENCLNVTETLNTTAGSLQSEEQFGSRRPLYETFQGD